MMTRYRVTIDRITKESHQVEVEMDGPLIGDAAKAEAGQEAISLVEEDHSSYALGDFEVELEIRKVEVIPALDPVGSMDDRRTVAIQMLRSWATSPSDERLEEILQLMGVDEEDPS